MSIHVLSKYKMKNPILTFRLANSDYCEAIALANISRTLTQHKLARRRSRVKAVAADADTLDSAAGFTAPDPFPVAFGVWGSQQGILERLPACLVPRYY